MTRDLYARGLRVHGAGAPWLGIVFVIVGVVAWVTSLRQSNPWAVAVPAGMAVLGVFLLIYPRLIASRVMRLRRRGRTFGWGRASVTKRPRSSLSGRKERP